VKVVPVEQTTLTLLDVAELAKSGTVILTRNGKPLVAIKDLSGSDWESLSLANDRRFLAIVEESRRAYREEGGIGLDELRSELGLKARARGRGRKKKP
jgi:hypothetical protein